MTRGYVLSKILIPAMICLLLVSCGHAGSGVESRHAPNTDSDDGADDDSGGDENPSPYNVIEKDTPGGDWTCLLPETCVWDYLHFLDLADPYSDPITEEELNRRIGDVENGSIEPLTQTLPSDVLRDAIGNILNIRFLLEGINERLLVATSVGWNVTPTYFEKELLFSDPYVGMFKGILLVPKGEGPFGAVVAIHGHRDDAQAYRDQYHGNEYPSRGYAILMLTMRAMGIDPFEHAVSHRFLRDGFTLIGLRSYEALLGLKYLRYLSFIDNDRIGLIGHSGGSSTGNLVVRVEPGFAAYVSDLTIDYCEWGTLLEPYHCETVPELFPYHLLINDFSTAETPVKEVPYGYTNGMEEIFDFFDDHL